MTAQFSATNHSALFRLIVHGIPPGGVIIDDRPYDNSYASRLAIARLLPYETPPLSSEDQALADGLHFQRRQRGYGRTAHNIVNREHASAELAMRRKAFRETGF
jgi:hypothetical protein